jgi:ABC-2 type transport system permease protein
MRSRLRIFFIGGLVSYRALFNWRHMSVYIPTMLGLPLFQTLFFAYLGRYAAIGDDTYFVIGNAAQTTAIAGIYGMVMSLANEREFGTLSSILATPANRWALYCGRAVPSVVNGLITSAFVFAGGCLLLDVRMPLAAVPAVAATVAVTAVSCTMFGLVIGSFSLRTGDLWVASNLTYNLLLLLCGVNVPQSFLPGWLVNVAQALPLTHGIQAARALGAGAHLSNVAGLIVREAEIGLGYAIAGYALLRLFETENRRRVSLEPH